MALTPKQQETYRKWKDNVNMSKSELQKFYDSEEGKEAGLSKSEADRQGIDYGRESARWILKMKDTPVSEWTDAMWRWAGKQNSFISRMSGVEGPLYAPNGKKSRKHLSLLIWGHNPEKFAKGGKLSDLEKLKKDSDDLINIEPEGLFEGGLDAAFFHKGGTTSQNKSPLDTILELAQPYQEELADQWLAEMKKNNQSVSRWEIEEYKLNLVLDLIKAVGRYLNSTDSITSVTLNKHKGVIEIRATIDRDGQKYYFGTNMIIAGGYNIQARHFRYLVDTKLPSKNTNPEYEKLKKELKRLSGVEKIKKDIDFEKKRLEVLKEKLETSKKNAELSDSEIESIERNNEPKYWQDYIDIKWEEIVRRGADKNYGYDEANFIKSKEEYRLSLINSWRNRYANVKSVQFEIKSKEKEIEKLNNKLSGVQGYKDGGTTGTLLAPNGKPSNLTPEQWHLVRTAEFKAWFGDWENDPENASKVVDDNGEPLVVYHGTTKEFNIFNLKYAKSQTKVDWGELGFFFTPSKELALDFTRHRWSSRKSKFRKGSRLIECFISVINPEKTTARKFVTPIKSVREYKDESLKMNFDGWVIEKFNDDDRESWIRLFGLGSVKEFDYNQFVAFHPNQIKLADGSNTTFDGSNPDIRYEQGGVVDGLISQGVVELSMFETDPQHAKEYGFESKKPLFVQRIYIAKDNRQKGIGSMVLSYIIDYAIKNEHDVIFGNITQKAEPKIDVIKSMLIKSGFNTCEGNNDFYKILAADSKAAIDPNNPDIRYGKGGRTIAQTPAPAKERIYGSDVNKTGTAESSQSAKEIKFSPDVIQGLKNKAREFNAKHSQKVSLDTLKAVYRRGAGAYSVSHRPTITGGRPNTRNAWAMARVNKFLKKKAGETVKAAYVQDDDLLEDGGQLKMRVITAENYFDGTACVFEPLPVQDAIEILDAYRIYRRKKNKPEFIETKNYGNLRVDFSSERKNAFFKSRSVSYYFVSENEDFVIRISDHWSKSNYTKSRKLNCGSIRSCYWENYGESFNYHLWGQAYSSVLIGGVCRLSNFQDNKFEGGGKLSKEAYEGKREWAAKKMAAMKSIESLTEEQHDTLAELCSFRHELHTNQKALFLTEHSNYDYFSKMLSGGINERLEEVGLPAIKGLENLFDDMPSDTDIYYDIADFETNEEGLEIALEKASEINKRIEDYLSEIDKQHGTSYCPSGYTRLYADGGSTETLLAPNGQPSNLTPEQWHLVRTPEFKAWFGDWQNDPENASKVLDENGEPMVCYHGSNNPNINVFDIEKSGTVKYSDWGSGIYFTPSKSTADYYSNEALKKIDSEYNRLYENYIKTNDYSDLKAFQDRDRLLFLNENTIVYGVFLNIRKPLVEVVDSMNYTDPFLSRSAIEREKDGVIIKTSRGRIDEILALYPNQIKLSDGSNTTFDPNNPDIRFEEGGSLDFISDVKFKILDGQINSDDGAIKLDEKGIEVNDNLYDELRELEKIFLNKNRGLQVGDKVLIKGKNGNEDFEGNFRGYTNDGKLIVVYRGGYQMAIEKDDLKFLNGGKTSYSIIKLADGGSTEILMAPNGQPSNLTPEQWHLVRTPEFKAWFGDWENDPENASKVVDDNGEPLICYHGTPDARFSVFDKERFHTRSKSPNSKGFFFTPEIWYATVYSESSNNEYREKAKELLGYYPTTIEERPYAKELPCFLNIRNPKYANDSSLDTILASKDNDGLIVFYNPSIYNDFVNDKIFEIVVFEPTQIKLADGSNKTFDPNNPDIRYAEGGEVIDLVALHNIRSNQLVEADKLGGLITPSIAIVKSGQSFTDFGEITLIGTKDLVDPKNPYVKSFSGDIYSQTVPAKLYYVNKSLLANETYKLIQKSYDYERGFISNKLDNTIGDFTDFQRNLNRYTYDELIKKYEKPLRIAYLVDKGIYINIPKKQIYPKLGDIVLKLKTNQKNYLRPILEKYSRLEGKGEAANVEQGKLYDFLMDIVKEHYKGYYKIIENAPEITQEDRDFLSARINRFVETYIGKRDDLTGYAINSLSQIFNERYELDEDKLEKVLDAEIKGDVKQDYDRWLSDFISQFRGAAYFEIGNQKYPYSKENLVEATAGKLRGKEKTLTFGINKAKSFAVKEFSSIDAMKKDAHKLVSKEQMTEFEKSIEQDFFNLAETIKYRYSDQWSKLDSLSKAVATYFKGTSVSTALYRNDFVDFDEDEIDLFKDFANTLRSAPSDYFEAKVGRAVQISEFKYAVVPKTTDKETLEVLRKNNVKFKKYGTTEERKAIVNDLVSTKKGLAFEEGGLVSEKQIALPDAYVSENTLKTVLDQQGYVLMRKENPDTGLLKPAKNITEIAKEKNVPLAYAKEQLKKGIEVEMEHTGHYEIAKKIALHHLDEGINYYIELAKVEKKSKK